MSSSMPFPHSDPDSVTRWLRRWQRGEPQAQAQVFDQLYRELRAIAARQLRRERPGHTLQATALVHEAFLRFQQQAKVEWRDRRHFLAYSSRVIRQVLVDYARARVRVKRGSKAIVLVFDEATMGSDIPPIDLIELHDALQRLHEGDPQKAAIVELRFFGGLTTEEIAEVLEISRITVLRQWRRSRAWLFHRMGANRSREQVAASVSAEQAPVDGSRS